MAVGDVLGLHNSSMMTLLPDKVLLRCCHLLLILCQINAWQVRIKIRVTAQQNLQEMSQKLVCHKIKSGQCCRIQCWEQCCCGGDAGDGVFELADTLVSSQNLGHASQRQMNETQGWLLHEMWECCKAGHTEGWGEKEEAECTFVRIHNTSHNAKLFTNLNEHNAVLLRTCTLITDTTSLPPNSSAFNFTEYISVYNKDCAKGKHTLGHRIPPPPNKNILLLKKERLFWRISIKKLYVQL